LDKEQEGKRAIGSRTCCQLVGMEEWEARGQGGKRAKIDKSLRSKFLFP